MYIIITHAYALDIYTYTTESATKRKATPAAKPDKVHTSSIAETPLPGLVKRIACLKC